MCPPPWARGLDAGPSNQPDRAFDMVVAQTPVTVSPRGGRVSHSDGPRCPERRPKAPGRSGPGPSNANGSAHHCCCGGGPCGGWPKPPGGGPCGGWPYPGGGGWPYPGCGG